MEATAPTLISIIIPAYNRAWCINRAIDSVLAQTYPHIEILVVDDGSTDNTAETVAVYGDRVQLLRQDNAGCAAARNRGIYSATGTYVIFLDSDDMLSPNLVQCHAETARQWPECDIFVARTLHVSPDGSQVLDENHWPPTPAQALELILLAAPPPPCSALYKRSALLKIKGFDPNFKVCEDSELLIRLALAGCTAMQTVGGHGIYMPSPDSLTETTSYLNFHRAFVQQHQKLSRLPAAQTQTIRGLLHRRMTMWRQRLWQFMFQHHVSLKPLSILRFGFHLVRTLRVDPGFLGYILRRRTAEQV